MSRDAGQVTTREALLGVLAIVLFAVAVVASAQALLRPVQTLPTAETPPPVEPDVPCPIPRETRARVPAPPSGPLPVTSGELIECPSAYDGRSVIYRGEVVRAVLGRGDRAWVQLNDDVYGLDIGPLPRHRSPAGTNSGIPVSIPIADADRISFTGDAGAHGDRLLVEGIFRRADPADAGGPAIQAHSVRIIAAGEPVTQRMTTARMVVALLLSAAALVMTITARRSNRP